MVVRNRRVAVALGVEPDFVTTSSLTIETESQNSQSPRDLAVTESRESAHSGSHDYREILALLAAKQGRAPFPLSTGLDEPAGYVPGYLQGLSDGSSLSDQTRKLV